MVQLCAPGRCPAPNITCGAGDGGGLDRLLLGVDVFLLAGFSQAAMAGPGAEEDGAWVSAASTAVCAPVLFSILRTLVFVAPWKEQLRNLVEEALSCLAPRGDSEVQQRAP